MDLALKAYEMAAEIDPELVGARLFAAECYLTTGQKDMARAELAAAKNIIDNGSAGQAWGGFFNKVAAAIGN